MATTEPLTGATVYQNSDAALGGQQIGDVANDLAKFTVPRFATTAARDTAYSAFVAAGGTIANGMMCWCESPGTYYERRSGAWVPRAGVLYGTTALDGTAIPASARITRLRFSKTVNIASTGVGAFNVAFGHTFTKLIAVAMWPGDNNESLGYIVPVVSNHTTTTAHGQARMTNGTVVPNTRLIRVELDVVGYNL